MVDYPEYKPVTHYCDYCGCEIDDEQDVYEVDPNGIWVCEECFKDYCIDNLDIDEMAKLWKIRKEKAYCV